MVYDIVISINVHEKISYLYKQLENIENFCKLKYIIILNCNEYMYKNLIGKKLKNCIINTNYFNKSRNTGLLFKGIYKNLKYALDKYDFEYFLLLSSRCFFFRELNNIHNIKGYKYNYKKGKGIWWRKSYEKSKLYKDISTRKNFNICSSPHEGVVLDKQNYMTVVNYFENHKKYLEELFNYKEPVEEFALQTLCKNLNGYFHFIAIPTTKTTKNPNKYNVWYIYKNDR